ncbi:putative replication protein [uncultured virus]|uniref:ATP-dependent helicase Rep n=1 Tax=uncultured virus TaxID=340016 RepID=A0A1I9XGC7_9VIRU|nr:putative replication protein [uncultured virus]
MAARNYMFTLFVEEKNEYLNLKNRLNNKEDTHVKYVICQLESCPSSGRLHVQGYVEFDKMMTIKQVKKILGEKTHLDKRQGTQEQAIKYCSKNDTKIEGPFIIGKKAQQGQRTDLEKTAERLRNGDSIELIIEENGNMLRYIKHMKEYKMLIEKKRDREEPVYVEVIVGDPGSGKTRYVYDKEPDLFVLPEQHGNSIWFDGYQGQEAVIFDDFYGGIKYSTMLRLLDRYPLRVPIKGGFTQWKAKRIYITSNQGIDKWYKIQDMRALKRRVSKIIIFEEQGNTDPLPIEESEI